MQIDVQCALTVDVDGHLRLHSIAIGSMSIVLSLIESPEIVWTLQRVHLVVVFSMQLVLAMVVRVVAGSGG